MRNDLDKEWEKLLKKEARCFIKELKKEGAQENGAIQVWTKQMREKIPNKLIHTLNAAFEKAFYVVFEKGVGVIEKTFQPDEINLDFGANDFRVSQSPTKKSLRRLDGAAKKSKMLNSCITTIEGVGLGALGIGLPDIPIFLAMLLKGIYEIAASYGFSYKDKREQVFILRLIHTSLAKGEEKEKRNRRVESWAEHIEDKEVDFSFDQEVRLASQALAEAMLMSKFIQGFFLVGAVGGVANPIIYRRISEYASLKYKKRYLASKRMRA